MNVRALAGRVRKFLHGLPVALFFLFTWAAAAAQDPFGFDDLTANEDLTSIGQSLDEEDVDSAFLTSASARIVGIQTSAASCVTAAGAERTRLEQRFAPLSEVGDDVPQDFIDQRAIVRTELDESIAAESRCKTVVDRASKLQTRISERQTELSQEFLSSRSQNIVTLILEFPSRAATWPAKLRESLSLELKDELTPVNVLWLIVIAGIVATVGGILLRLWFRSWYRRNGGEEAAPKFRYLLPKPIAEFAPLWLIGIAFIAVLEISLQDASIDLLLVRVAWAVFLFGIACVVIDWATGPLSPSVEVKGLIPDHVKPLRLRLRVLFLTICSSFVVLGGEWLSVRVTEPYVSGRASMIFLVAVAFLYLFLYLPKIPGVKGRFRLFRLLAVLTTGLCIVAVFSGYQNFAAFLIHGVTRTGVALFVLWILIWLVYVGFDFLLNQETPTAARARASLGVTKTGKGTGIGFMRLVADLVLWLSFIVYMIYVWDESGSTLGKLVENVKVGWPIGNVQIIPLNIIGGILVFAGVIIVIGWLKRWIDRRWLQHIVAERGARDAIMTLFGYIGFVIAVLVALAMADVDLTGIALISGALALGIGFGMQEIANNFVSGIILLFERPIRTGDFVTVGEVEGFVRRIRIRATEIETLDNQNVLVPNSELISGRVINWVLRDTYGRLQIKVGVAYGSDIENVRHILESI
ncbi:MAG: mechanosensitive ion channel, partial [Proteobacteria bacterium]|nr:mechanosensitive ion channel [Pseudomonadota bacterium]